MAISQLPNVLERSIKAQIEYPLFIYDYWRSLFYTGSIEIQINKYFAQIRRYFQKPTIFGRSSPKSIEFLRKHVQISMRNFRVIRATSIELSRDKKLTTYTQTHKQTDGWTNKQANTHTYIFGKRFFSQFRSYIDKENGEI